MAQITFNIPDPQASRVLDALSSYYGWTSSLGVTKLEFVKSKLIELFVQLVKEAEINTARNNATNNVITNFVDPSIT